MPWIRFRGKMYNVTAGEYYDSAPTLYTLAYYGGNQIAIGDDGTTRTDIPLAAFDGIEATNIGIQFEGIAKEYYSENNEWPILRLCTSNATDDYYLEWNHSSPTGFTLCTNGHAVRWDHCYAWNDTIGSEGGHRYINQWCYVWVSAWKVEDLDTLSIIWTGGLTGNDTLGLWETIISYATLSISVRPEFILTEPHLIMTTNAKRTSSAGNRYRYFEKTGTGIAIAYVFKTNRWLGPAIVAPLNSGEVIPPYSVTQRCYGDYSGITTTYSHTVHWNDLDWGFSGSSSWDISDFRYTTYEPYVPVFEDPTVANIWSQEELIKILTWIDPIVTLIKSDLYIYLTQTFEKEPPSDVDPDDIPPEDDPPTPIPPDDQDPYYDPTSDPTNPDYDPTKDPESPDYDPTEPHTPYRPPSGPSQPTIEEEHPPQDPIPTPETPPSYVTTNAMFTLYNPSGGDLTNLANFLWSPTWSIDTFKKIFANPLDCILGLMVMPHLSASVSTKTMNVGNISTGVTMHYFTSQFYDFDCGTFELLEYYNSYLDYAPYTKVNIFLPYIGDKQLSTDEVMNKTLGVKYRFDLATGDCIAFVTVNGTVLYSFSGNCAARLPLSGNNWNGIIPAITGVAISAGSMAAGLPALGAASAAAVSTMKETISHTGNISGSAGLMGIQKPYLIVTRPRQALPLGQNSFTGYPSFITESLGSLTGYTEVEQCHLEHVPATGAELEEIERLLKEGVLF